MNKIIANYKEFQDRNKKSHGYLLKHTVSTVSIRILRAIMLFGLCFMILQPLLNKLSISFMTEKDLYDATVISVPRNFTFENYKLVDLLMNYRKGLYNSLMVALGISVLQIVTCTLVGYGFARYKFPFKNFWFACVMLIILIPPQTLMTSIYLHFRYFDIFGIIKAVTGKPLNLLNTSYPYFMMVAGCMGLKSGLYIFMIRQYFRGVPKELEEAAYVDGCGTLRTFAVIMLPDAKPIITSCFLFAFVWQWTDSFYSTLFLRKFVLLPSGLASISERLRDYYNLNVGTGALPTIAYTQAMISTGMLISIIPLVLIYIVAQKGFVETLSQTGIKM